MEEVKKYLKKEYPKFNGFVEHTLVAEMAMNFAKYYHTKQLGLSEVSRSVWMVQDKFKMLVYGIFSTQEKATKFANGSEDLAIIKLDIA